MSAENLLRILDELAKIEQYLGHEFLERLTDICGRFTGEDAKTLVAKLTDNYYELYDLLVLRFDSLNQP
jgi:hypothetical protein